MLGNGPHVFVNGPHVLGNRPHVLGNGPHVLGNGPHVLGNGPHELGMSYCLNSMSIKNDRINLLLYEKGEYKNRLYKFCYHRKSERIKMTV